MIHLRSVDITIGPDAQNAFPFNLPMVQQWEQIHFASPVTFLKFFEARFVPRGLYMLDEPEAPLSPLRQLSLLSMLKEMVEAKEAQFIIATHSPILMAFPDAAIMSFDDYPVRPVAYEDVEHVSLTRDFLNRPEQFLRHL